MSKILYNIPCNYNFLESLYCWLFQKYHSFTDLRIYLPSRRAVSEFKNIFREKLFCGQLPIIKAIGDIDYEDFYEFLNDENQEVFSSVLNAKKLSAIEAIFFLTKEVKKIKLFKEISDQQAYKIAIKFQELFDEIEFEQITFSKIEGIENSDLAIHRQISIDFIKDFYSQTKYNLIKDNLYFASSYQNFIIKNFCEILENSNSLKNIVIAGSTGSLNCTKNLIKQISNLKNGQVIFNNFIHKNNPQIINSQFLNNLLYNHIGTNIEVSNIIFDQFKLANDSRVDFINEILKNSHEVISWQNFHNHQNIEEIKNDISANFLIFEASNVEDEASFIVERTLSSSVNNNKIAIINNNDLLTNIITNKLELMNINYNYLRSKKLSQNSLMIFLTQLINLSNSDFNSSLLLSIFKNDLFYCPNKDILYDFENLIIRENREFIGLKGLISQSNKFPDLKFFFENFLANLPQKNDIDSIILSLEKITNQTLENLLKNNEASQEIKSFFNILKNHNYYLKSTDELIFLLSSISYFSNNYGDAKITILSNIEARLLNFDLVIISSLNYGDFPNISDYSWLGKQIAKELGIDRSQKKISQNNFDFSNYLGNKKIILTRSIKVNNDYKIASPLLVKFSTLIKKLSIENISIKSEFKTAFNVEYQPSKLPKFAPPQQFLPSTISITDFDNLINNPYLFYLKKILKLKPINEIDYQSGVMEFGNFCHKVLELYVNKQLANQNINNIFVEYFNNIEARYTWFARFEKLFENFLEDNENYDKCTNLVEYQLKLAINNITVVGRADRIIVNDNKDIHIIDYKTGSIASQKSIQLLKFIQLPLQALLYAMSNSINLENIAKLEYWKLSLRNEKNTVIAKNPKTNNCLELILKTKSLVEEIINNYFIENQPFIASNDDKIPAFKNITRTQEWDI